jgi:hypothetical protein
VLAEVSSTEAHHKDLAELVEAIATKMIEPKSGCGSISSMTSFVRRSRVLALGSEFEVD